MRPKSTSAESRSRRKYPIGATIVHNGVHFRVWAPKRKQIEVLLTEGPGAPDSVLLQRQTNGYFEGVAAGARHATRYRFRPDAQEASFPDPSSRFQPDGPHGDSQVVDPQFPWTDQAWQGPQLIGQVLYEMHIGTFTREGTWDAAAAQLAELSSAGITAIELMPVADFPGRFGWGYDGVNLFAPTWLYGAPEHFRAFVDTAHSHQVAVILDVVYNHLGPDGNYLRQFSDDYFSRKYTTDWGDAINFDDANAEPVREFFLANAAYWIKDFHLDGLRLDATQNIYDASPTHILKEITRVVRAAARPRSAIVIAENEPQDTRLVRPAARAPSGKSGSGGFGMDALWNDDFHHSALVALTGRSEAYYADYRGSAQELVSAVKHGFLYQGQWYSWQKQRRGSQALDLPPETFVNFIQNHDQIANSATGQRVDALSSPGALRAMTALLLLCPGTPLLFQGQEFAASTPFRYFSDHKPEISKLVLKGRAEFLSQFQSLHTPESQAALPDPGNPATFEACKLDFSERERHAPAYTLHKDLLRLRREDPVFRRQSKALDGAVLDRQAFVLRFFDSTHGDRILLVNLETDLELVPGPEPLLAPPRGRSWAMIFSTDDQQYGGSGAYSPETDTGWRIPGRAAVVLAARSAANENRESQA
jgi:maltooligosyltrehalose trehalohydrolase